MAKENTKNTRQPQKVRLQKILAAAGIDSRRKCEQLIASGAVTVNGQLVTSLPAFADPQTDDIRVDGKRIRLEKKVYFMFNKPKNVICTNYDPQGRKKAVDFVDCPQRIFCVGRLDVDTTGLILLTNDAQLANRLTHPRYELPKTYHVTIRGSIESDHIEKLKKGVWLAEGKTGKAAVKILHRDREKTVLEVTIRQGLNRQLRRSFARLGYKVKALTRVAIGRLELKGLALGQYKPLTASQIAYLYRATGLASDSQP